jgi:hypothetical protein
MRCPECERAGRAHTFHQERVPPGPILMTEERSRAEASKRTGVDIFWDERGKKHVHDHEVRTWVYRCSNGHAYKQTAMSACIREECPWNDQPLVKAGQEPLG